MTARRPRSISVSRKDRTRPEEDKVMCITSSDPPQKPKRGAMISRLIDDFSKRGKRSVKASDDEVDGVRSSRSGTERASSAEPVVRSSDRCEGSHRRQSKLDMAPRTSQKIRETTEGRYRHEHSEESTQINRSPSPSQRRHRTEQMMNESSSRSSDRVARRYQHDLQDSVSSRERSRSNSRSRRGGAKVASVDSDFPFDANGMTSSSGKQRSDNEAEAVRDHRRSRSRSRSRSWDSESQDRNKYVPVESSLLLHEHSLAPPYMETKPSPWGQENFDTISSRPRSRSRSRSSREERSGQVEVGKLKNGDCGLLGPEPKFSPLESESKSAPVEVFPAISRRHRSRSKVGCELDDVADAEPRAFLDDAEDFVFHSAVTEKPYHNDDETSKSNFSNPGRSRSNAVAENPNHSDDKTSKSSSSHHGRSRSKSRNQSIDSSGVPRPRSPRSESDFATNTKSRLEEDGTSSKDRSRSKSRRRREEDGRTNGSELSPDDEGFLEGPPSDREMPGRVAGSHGHNSKTEIASKNHGSFFHNTAFPSFSSYVNGSFQFEPPTLPVDPLDYLYQPLASMEDLLQRCDVARTEKWLSQGIGLATMRNRLGIPTRRGKVGSDWVPHLLDLYQEFVSDVDKLGDSSVYVQAVLDSSSHEPEAAILMFLFLEFIDGFELKPDVLAISDSIAKIQTIACWCREIMRYPNEFPDALLECCLAHLHRFSRIVDRHERMQHILCILFRGSKKRSALEELRADLLNLVSRADGAGFMTVSRAVFLQNSVEVAVVGNSKSSWSADQVAVIRSVLQRRRGKSVPDSLFFQLEKQLHPFCAGPMCYKRAPVQCCGQVFYCTRSCRDAGWDNHQIICKRDDQVTLSFPDSVSSSPSRAISRGDGRAVDALKTPKTPSLRFHTIGDFDKFLVAPLSTPKKQRERTIALVKQDRALRECRDTDYFVFQSWGKLGIVMNPPTKQEFRELRANAMDTNDDVEEMFELLSRLCPEFKSVIKNQLESEYAIGLRNLESPAGANNNKGRSKNAGATTSESDGQNEDFQKEQQELQRIYEHQLMLQRRREQEQQHQLLLLYEKHKQLERLRLQQQAQLMHQHHHHHQQQESHAAPTSSEDHKHLERQRIDRRRGQYESDYELRRIRSNEV